MHRTDAAFSHWLAVREYRLDMSRWSDEATSGFLSAAADDLQRQMGQAGVVEEITAEDAPGGVALVARIRVMNRTIEVRARGESLIEAYAALRLAVAEPVLIAAYDAYVTH